VDRDRRLAVVAALVELATSDAWLDRADAGRALASFAELPESREPLLRLVLDAEDTFVTRVTAEALLRRNDRAGIAIVAEALAAADFQHGTYIHEAVEAVFLVFASERDQAMAICEALGAAELRGMLAAVDPLLHPQDPA